MLPGLPRLLASGYAWGCEDSTGVRTASPNGTSGDYMFAEAFTQGYADYNAGQRGSMTDVRSAYTRWQETGGATIFRDGDTTADHAARRATMHEFLDPKDRFQSDGV